MSRLLVALALVLVSTLAPDVRAQDYKLAPPAEELDRRADEYVMNRRIMAIVIVGGTFVVGLVSGLARRRARLRAQRELEAQGSPGERRPTDDEV